MLKMPLPLSWLQGAMFSAEGELELEADAWQRGPRRRYYFAMQVPRACCRREHILYTMPISRAILLLRDARCWRTYAAASVSRVIWGRNAG